MSQSSSKAYERYENDDYVLDRDEFRFRERNRYAGFWRRVGAYLLDQLLVGFVGWALGTGIDLAVAAYAGPQPQQPIWLQLAMTGVGMVIGVVLHWLYAAILESSAKQATLGKQALGIKVTDLDGRRLSFAHATGRHFAEYLTSLTVGVGYIMAGFTEKKQALHDLIAGTLVVKGYGDGKDFAVHDDDVRDKDDVDAKVERSRPDERIRAETGGPGA